MHLAWIQYQKGSKVDYHLILLLAELDDRYLGLECDRIPDDQIDRIRKALDELIGMNIGEKLNWFKTNVSYNTAFKEFLKSRTHIDKTFALSKK